MKKLKYKRTYRDSFDREKIKHTLAFELMDLTEELNTRFLFVDGFHKDVGTDRVVSDSISIPLKTKKDVDELIHIFKKIRKELK